MEVQLYSYLAVQTCGLISSLCDMSYTHYLQTCYSCVTCVIVTRIHCIPYIQVFSLSLSLSLSLPLSPSLSSSPPPSLSVLSLSLSSPFLAFTPFSLPLFSPFFRISLCSPPFPSLSFCLPPSLHVVWCCVCIEWFQEPLPWWAEREGHGDGCQVWGRLEWLLHTPRVSESQCSQA